jgi:dTDP-4-dehydrorhamnose reductase
MAKVLVTGATGLLGSTLVPWLRERGHHIICLARTQATDVNVDLASYEQTARALDRVKPEVIINLIASTDVDSCEVNPQEAYLLNVKPLQNLCAWIQKTAQPCHLIQISSDQMYDGLGPHVEDDLTIRNHYAMSKLAGELAAGIVPSTILRTNFVGRSLRKGRASFTDWLYSALSGTSPIFVFDDVMFSPLRSNTLCDYIERTVVEQPIGIFNLGSRDGMSKADFAFAFAEATSLPTANLVRTNASSVVKLIARRPNDMRMNCHRFEDHMGIELPRLIDEIHGLVNDYR